MKDMNFAEIKYCDIANGPGVRTSLFVSGCTHRCKNCFNEIAWDFGYGEPFTGEIAEQIYDSCRPEYVSGITLLGGEPMEPVNQNAIFPFVTDFKKRYPDKNIWCYSGYTYEELTGIEDSRCRCEITDELLEYIDVLVDGKYVDELHDITLRFRGSSNQRLIDLKKTRASGCVVLWQDDPIFSKHGLPDR